ncbi:MAG: hypothetical protein ACI4D3_01070 [Lachnospiraceae bacterium]
MTLSEVQLLLDQNGITYHFTTEPNRAVFYQRKGFSSSDDTGAFHLLTIPNPNHSKVIKLIFEDSSSDADFYDLEFGGYWYELWGWNEEGLAENLLDEIKNILDGKAYVIFATDAKTGKWFADSLYCDREDPEWNDMDSFQKAVTRIKKPKSWWRKLIQRTDIYEIFNWNSYEKVVK